MGGSFSRTQRKAVIQLVWDCIQYSFTEQEALKYIELRLGRTISPKSIYVYKKKINSGEFTNQWLSNFTRIGYLISHHDLIDTAEKQHRDIVRRLFYEENKDPRDEYKIMRLRSDLREQDMHIIKLKDATPIVAQVTKLLTDREQKQTNDGISESGKEYQAERYTIPPIE